MWNHFFALPTELARDTILESIQTQIFFAEFSTLKYSRNNFFKIKYV